MPRTDELRQDIARARGGLREAIELAAAGWEQARAPLPGEDEVWSPRQTAEHTIAAEAGFASAIARALERSVARPQPAELPDLEAALRALDVATDFADAVLESVTDDDLALDSEVAGSVEGVMKLAAWHLRNHARQILGIEQM